MTNMNVMALAPVAIVALALIAGIVLGALGFSALWWIVPLCLLCGGVLWSALWLRALSRLA